MNTPEPKKLEAEIRALKAAAQRDEAEARERDGQGKLHCFSKIMRAISSVITPLGALVVGGFLLFQFGFDVTLTQLTEARKQLKSTEKHLEKSKDKLASTQKAIDNLIFPALELAYQMKTAQIKPIGDGGYVSQYETFLREFIRKIAAEQGQRFCWIGISDLEEKRVRSAPFDDGRKSTPPSFLPYILYVDCEEPRSAEK